MVKHQGVEVANVEDFKYLGSMGGMGLQRGKEEENHGVRESDRVPFITKGRI